jgi:SulP family sulfate permease
VNGSQSRSVVMFEADAKPQIAVIVAALLVLVTLLWLTPLFESLPRSALAGVVLVAAVGLVDIAEFKSLFRLRPADFYLALATTLGVLTIGMLGGIVIAVVLSLMDVVRRTITPNTAVLGEVPGTDSFRDVTTLADFRSIRGLLIYRFEAPLFFANADVFADEVMHLVEQSETAVQAVLIDAEGISDIDTTAVAVVEELIEDLAARGVEVGFARVRQPVEDMLRATGIVDEIGEDRIFLEADDGVAFYEAAVGGAEQASSAGDADRPG